MNTDRIYNPEGLTDYERDVLLPTMIACLKNKHGKGKATTNSTMRLGLQAHGYKTVGAPRVRKLINFIRVNGLVECLIACSEGYFVSDNVQEVEEYIETLKSRENAIRAMREHVEEQCENLRSRTSSD